VHEMSLAQSILEIVGEYAVEHGFKQVNTLNLSLGRLTCVEISTLTFAFETNAKGTPAEGARLNFKVLPPRIHCFTCNEDMEVESFGADCPKCGGSEIMLIGGTEELKLIDMDVD